MHRIAYLLTAAGTALTASSSETVLASGSLKAFSLQPGKVYRVRAAVLATATNSTDTLTVRLRVGPTTLTGTVVGSSGAVDAANSDVVVVDVEMVVRDADSSSVVLAHGLVSAVGAEGTGTARSAFESLALDSGAEQLVEITGQWSSTSAGNSCRCDALTITELV